MSIERLKPADLGAHVGEVFGVSSWIVVDQHRINEFARCTDDRQWIHMDVERATKEGPFGGTIAHGFLTLALLAPTIFEVMLSRVEAKQAINYGLESVRLLAPVRAGRRVRNRLKIASMEEKGARRTLLTTENTLEIEGEGKPALIALAQVMLMA
jgi:acyl dehydratase